MRLDLAEELPDARNVGLRPCVALEAVARRLRLAGLVALVDGEDRRTFFLDRPRGLVDNVVNHSVAIYDVKNIVDCRGVRLFRLDGFGGSLVHVRPTVHGIERKVRYAEVCEELRRPVESSGADVHIPRTRLEYTPLLAVFVTGRILVAGCSA